MVYGVILWHFLHILGKTAAVQVQEIESELNSRKQEEAKRRRDVQEISEQVTALELELNNLDETVDYQVTMFILPKVLLVVKFRLVLVQLQHFYRAMHFSAKRSLAITCCPSVCPSVCL